MIKAIIVDDEQRSRDTLERMITQFCPEVSILRKVESVAEAIVVIDSEMPDVVFLDIEMPTGNGFTLIEHYEEPGFEVIFTTAHDLYAINAIKFAALDYLLKPVNIRELQEAIKRVRKKLNHDTSTVRNKQIEVLRSNLSQTDSRFTKIALPNSEGIDLVKANDIIRADAERSYSVFWLSDGNRIMVSKPLKEYERLLEQCNFFRVHKSHMVNLNRLDKYVRGKGGYVVMDDGSHVNVSVRRKEELLKVLTNRE